MGMEGQSSRVFQALQASRQVVLPLALCSALKHAGDGLSVSQEDRGMVR